MTAGAVATRASLFKTAVISVVAFATGLVAAALTPIPAIGMTLLYLDLRFRIRRAGSAAGRAAGRAPVQMPSARTANLLAGASPSSRRRGASARPRRATLASPAVPARAERNNQGGLRRLRLEANAISPGAPIPNARACSAWKPFVWTRSSSRSPASSRAARACVLGRKDGLPIHRRVHRGDGPPESDDHPDTDHHDRQQHQVIAAGPEPAAVAELTAQRRKTSSGFRIRRPAVQTDSARAPLRQP